MLHNETILPRTLELLNKLMQPPFPKDFYLAGGTALALQIGHRISIDLDLFSSAEFNADEIIEQLNSLGSVCLLYTSPSPRDLSTSRMPSSA